MILFIVRLVTVSLVLGILSTLAIDVTVDTRIRSVIFGTMWCTMYLAAISLLSDAVNAIAERQVRQVLGILKAISDTNDTGDAQEKVE